MGHTINKSENVLDDLPLAIIGKLPDTGIVTVRWKEECTNLLRDDHKDQIEQINRVLKDLQPQKLLIDLNRCRYVFSPTTNDWFNNMLVQLFGKSNPGALAFVVPSNLFNHILFEASEESLHRSNTETQYFREEEKAIGWLENK